MDIKIEHDSKLEKGLSTPTKEILITMLVSLILLVGIWVWKNLDIRQIKENAATERIPKRGKQPNNS